VTTLAVGSLVWIGLLIGVSFLATPVKFLAPSLSLPVALDVGRQTFHWFGRVELVLAAVMLLAALATKHFAGRDDNEKRRIPVAALLAVGLLAAVGAQSAWLLPLLDARVEIILGGGMPAPSMLHRVYVAFEAAKLGVLIAVAWIAIGRLRGAA
jgi:hypothetical protein